MYGRFALGVSYSIVRHVAIRGDADYYNSIGTGGDATGYGVSLGVPLYFKKMYDGFFVEPSFLVIKTNALLCSADSVGLGPTMLIGGHWIWDAGFIVALAPGVGHTWIKQTESGYMDEGLLLSAGYLRVGYAFSPTDSRL